MNNNGAGNESYSYGSGEQLDPRTSSDINQMQFNVEAALRPLLDQNLGLQNNIPNFSSPMRSERLQSERLQSERLQMPSAFNTPAPPPLKMERQHSSKYSGLISDLQYLCSWKMGGANLFAYAASQMKGRYFMLGSKLENSAKESIHMYLKLAEVCSFYGGSLIPQSPVQESIVRDGEDIVFKVFHYVSTELELINQALEIENLPPQLDVILLKMADEAFSLAHIINSINGN